MSDDTSGGDWGRDWLHDVPGAGGAPPAGGPPPPAGPSPPGRARPRQSRAARRRAVRRRRLVALTVLVALVALIVVFVLRACGGDPFAGTWKKSNSSGLVITKVDDRRYKVTNLAGTVATTAVRTNDTLTTRRKVGGKKVKITLTPGSQANTLEEHFPDGTTDVLARQ